MEGNKSSSTWPKYKAIRILVFLIGGFSCLCATGASAKPVYIDPEETRAFSRLSREAPNIRYQQDGMRVLLRSEAPRGEAWVYDVTMSRACRRGQFKQRANRRYVAVFDEQVYGAAVGGHKSLVDKAGLSQPNVIYVFKGQGSTGCRVYHRTQ